MAVVAAEQLNIGSLSSEMYGRQFPMIIFSEVSGNMLITYVNQLFPSPALQSDAVK